MSKVKSQKKRAASTEIEDEEVQNDYVKPSKQPGKTDSSNWPLLLKVIATASSYLYPSRILIVSMSRPTTTPQFPKAIPP